MKIKLLSTLVLFTSQISFSQTIKGKIVFNNYVIPKVDVINANSKTLSISDAYGHFSIDAKMNDTLVFIAKNYELKKIVINPLIINDKNLIIELILKAEELKEVVITKIENKTTWLTKEEIEQIKLNSSRPKQGLKIIDYKEPPVLFGVDFIRLGKQVRKLLKKEETIKNESPEANFKDFAKKKCNQSYFLGTLKLKLEEIELFLEFCNFDPESQKIVSENPNVLVLMDFLYKKNIEFKKINASE
jgi:hypothetical protein